MNILQRKPLIIAMGLAVAVSTTNAIALSINMSPDTGTLQTYWTEQIGTTNDWNVQFGWSHTVTSADDPSFTYVGFTGQWILEGIATTDNSIGGGAGDVLSLTIMDVGSNTANAPGNYSPVLDGVSGAFRFNPNLINVVTYANTAPFTGNGGSLDFTGANPNGSFSNGYLFAAAPANFSTSGPISATIMSPINVTNLPWVLNLNEPVVSTVPVPGAAWLFSSGLVGLVGIIARRRRKYQSTR